MPGLTEKDQETVKELIHDLIRLALAILIECKRTLLSIIHSVLNHGSLF